MSSNNLRALCDEFAQTTPGRLSPAEWSAACMQNNMHNYLDLMGFRWHDVMEFYQMLSEVDQDGQVDVDTFVGGVMRLKSSCFKFRHADHNVQPCLHARAALDAALVPAAGAKTDEMLS